MVLGYSSTHAAWNSDTDSARYPGRWREDRLSFVSAPRREAYGDSRRRQSNPSSRHLCWRDLRCPVRRRRVNARRERVLSLEASDVCRRVSGAAIAYFRDLEAMAEQAVLVAGPASKGTRGIAPERCPSVEGSEDPSDDCCHRSFRVARGHVQA